MPESLFESACSFVKKDCHTQFSPREVLWRCGVVVIITAQLRSIKSELWFCAGSNPARGVSEICNSENLWQWSRLKIRRKRLSSVNHSAKAIHHHHHHHHFSRTTAYEYCNNIPRAFKMWEKWERRYSDHLPLHFNSLILHKTEL